MHRHIPLFLLIALALAACTSGDQNRLEPARQPADPQQILGEITSPQPGPAVDGQVDYLREIDSAPVPDGVDAELWRQLCNELKRVVAARQSRPVALFQSAGPPGSRQVSFTPYGSENLVRDLHLGGSGPYLLTWTYRNSGDYDLNGSVNISDLTPIGVNYGINQDDPLWFLSINADGDGNGEINISDITPIGNNFGGTVVGYRVFGTDNMADQWTNIGQATVETHLRKNCSRLRFVIRLDSLDYKYYGVWPFDNSDDEGGWSNTAALGSGVDRRVAGCMSFWSTP